MVSCMAALIFQGVACFETPGVLECTDLETPGVLECTDLDILKRTGARANCHTATKNDVCWSCKAIISASS